ncbi:MAG: RIO1 family regulatory kinase/ATPase [Phycisphaerales bacterium]
MLDELQVEVDAFREAGLLTEFVGELKSGKEATVYLAKHGEERLALKRYRPFYGRGFLKSARYLQGRYFTPRDERALTKGSRHGRAIAADAWIGHEFEAMRRAAEATPLVPKARGWRGRSILMEFIPEAPTLERPAPRMIDTTLTATEASRFHREIMVAVIAMFEIHLVHADLSPYNILVEGCDESGDDARRAPRIIDFPQSVDPRWNPNARAMLEHDIAEITKWLRRFNEEVDDRNLAARLWEQLESGRI